MRGAMNVVELANPGSGLPVAGTVAAAVAMLNRPTDSMILGTQLAAYGALAGRWSSASEAERPALAKALGDSPFAHRIQSVLNGYTRAAWAGPDAVPPAPQVQALRAFDALSGLDRQIVAALRGGALGESPLTTVAEYRARLQSELEAAAAAASPRRPDSVTLSDAAQAARDGTPAQPPAVAPPEPQPRSTQMAAALAAYAKTARLTPLSRNE
jgi:hypothetical protein